MSVIVVWLAPKTRKLGNFSLTVENEQPDAGQDDRPNLSRETEISGANRDRENNSSSQNAHPVDRFSLLLRVRFRRYKR